MNKPFTPPPIETLGFDPAELRERLAAETSVLGLEVVKVMVGDNGLTRKALFKLPDGSSLGPAGSPSFGNPASGVAPSTFGSTGPGSSFAADFCATSTMLLPASIAVSSALIDFGRPTNSGITMCGKTTTSRNGNSGSWVGSEN